MTRFDPLLFWAVAAVLFFTVGLTYFFLSIPPTTEMANQPSIKPQEQPFLPPPQSVPIHGRERKVELLEASELKNPVEATPASLEQGQRLFAIYCAVCHGTNAKGKGPIAKKLTTPPDDLTQTSTAEQPDGYLYTVIREGGDTMPGQAEGLSSRERWDIVNYLRSLQKIQKRG